MRIDRKSATLIAALLLSTNLTAEESKAVAQVFEKMPEIKNISDKEILKNFIYNNAQNLSPELVQTLVILSSDTQAEARKSLENFDIKLPKLEKVVARDLSQLPDRYKKKSNTIEESNLTSISDLSVLELEKTRSQPPKVGTSIFCLESCFGTTGKNAYS